MLPLCYRLFIIYTIPLCYRWCCTRQCRYLPAASSACAQSPRYKQGRDIPYFLPGCFSDPDDAGKTAPAPPPCDPRTITMETCAAACAAWAPRIPGAGNGEVWAAMQAGYACACGTQSDGDAAKKTDKMNELAWAACDNKCPGDPLQACGGGGRNTLVRIECGIEWGHEFLVVLFVACGCYVGGGIAWAAKTRGAVLSPRSHPHWTTWLELHGLVLDGVRFVRSGRNTNDESSRHSLTSDKLLNKVPKGGKKKSTSKGSKKVRDSNDEGKTGPQNAGESRSGANKRTISEPEASQSCTAAGTPAGGGGRWVHVPV
eukprot:SAG31_NODE_1449_length_8308_cov_2.319893_2_plen_315_part_00